MGYNFKGQDPNNYVNSELHITIFSKKKKNPL